jgi:hypothetical protein
MAKILTTDDNHTTKGAPATSSGSRMICKQIISISTAALWLLWAGGAAAQDAPEAPLRLNLKLGLESDSNPTRQEGPDTRADALTRYFLKASYQERLGAAQQLSARLLSGGKKFQRESQEDALLTQLDLRYALWPLEAWAQRWLSLWARGDLKDRGEQGSQRDYLRLGASGGLGLELDWLSLSAGAGANLFHFKPDPRQSSQGPQWEASASARWSDAWSLTLSWSLAQRRFTSDRFLQRPSGDVVQEQGQLRRDDATALGANLTWRGPVILGLTLSLLDNASNSYGQALQRTGATLLVTAPLPWELFVSARLGLLRTAFSDRIFILDDTLSVDEENRNTLVVEVERPLWGPLSALVGYSLYTQELGADEADYLRQIVFVGVGFGEE